MLTLILWFLGIVLFLIILTIIIVVWGIPKLKRYLKQKYSPTIKKGLARVIEGGIEREYASTLIAATPIELTYRRDEPEISLDGKSKVYKEDHFPLKVFDDKGVAVGDTNVVLNAELGVHVYRVDLGNCIAYPLTQDGAKYPEGLFNVSRQAEIQTAINQSVTADHGIDTKLVIIIGMFLLVIATIVAVVTVLNKQSVTNNNIYTLNQTANQTYVPPPPGPVTVNGTLVK